ncbi:GNAT family N-acetyltransferase [Burkholderia gladioli]|uniref:GNAT family N-acetyltransferase n=1 Tax=Burkholderia gladioli TaxID=28095 RepID=UPI001640DD98|nr:GNAT family N-acetyltransferase [Burkholderia gladioli]
MNTHAPIFEILTVSADQVYPLRARLLLDGDEIASRLSGDLGADTLHLGIRRGEQLVGVASVCREDCPDLLRDGWRLRGMAIDEALRGFGFGRVLVRLCAEHARGRGGRTLWCTARETAKGFYEGLGFTSDPQVLSLPTKPDVQFYRMWMDI